MAELNTPFHCAGCGLWHSTLPLSYSVQYPLAALRVPPDEVEFRVVLTRDQCVIDGTRFYLRGRVLVPVHGLAEPFVWGVWAEVSPKAFLRTQQLWRDPARVREPAFAAWLDTDLPLFGSTLNLEVRVQTQPVGRRPHFEVVAREHPLGLEQRRGISLGRVEEIAGVLLHPVSEPVR